VGHSEFVTGKKVYENRIFKLADSTSQKTHDIYYKIQKVKNISRNLFVVRIIRNPLRRICVTSNF